ncbi:MAG: helix-turn-helix transcriptional regulator [bacterium]
MSTATQEVELLTLTEAATLMGVGPRTLHRWAAEGRAPAGVKLTPGRRGARRWSKSELLEWIRSGCPDPRSETPSK